MSECVNCGRSLDWQDPEACGTGDPMGFDYTTTIECLGHGLERAKARLASEFLRGLSDAATIADEEAQRIKHTMHVDGVGMGWHAGETVAHDIANRIRLLATMLKGDPK